MPIRPELKEKYPADWPEISRRIRFVRAQGRCEKCGRPHGHVISQLVDGTWLSPDGRWYDDDGHPAWPGDLLAIDATSPKKVILAAAHLDHDPVHCSDHNLKALCGRCHLAHDREEHIRRRRIYRRARFAIVDLFDGPYPQQISAGRRIVRRLFQPSYLPAAGRPTRRRRVNNA